MLENDRISSLALYGGSGVGDGSLPIGFLGCCRLTRGGRTCDEFWAGRGVHRVYSVLNLGTWKCRSLIMWAEVIEGHSIGPELVQETNEKISLIKDKLKKGVVRFRKKEKLAPRFFGPFEINEKVGTVAYRLDLPGVHDTFHVLNLMKCLANPTLHVLLDEIRFNAKLN
nr:hypothetical protein [Tanacetum cinerariifolium]